MVFPAIGIFIGTLWVHKTFEEKRNNFLTGYFFSKTRFRILNILFAIGIIAMLLMNSPSFEKQIYDSNLELVQAIVSDSLDVGEMQITFVKGITGALKINLENKYNSMPEQTKNQCGSMYNELTQTLTDYENQISAPSEQELSEAEQNIIESLPIFNTLVKIAPLFVALFVYVSLSILTVFISMFLGIVYSITESGAKKIKNNKNKKKVEEYFDEKETNEENIQNKEIEKDKYPDEDDK